MTSWETLSDKELSDIEFIIQEPTTVKIRTDKLSDSDQKTVIRTEALLKKASPLEENIVLYKSFKGLSQLRDGGELTEPAFLFGTTVNPNNNSKDTVTLAITIDKGVPAVELPGNGLLFGRGIKIEIEPTKKGVIPARIVSPSIEETDKDSFEPKTPGKFSAIRLVTKDPEELHLLGQHDQSSHAPGGHGGMSKGAQAAKTGAKKITSEEAEARQDEIVDSLGGSRNKAKLFKAEDDLEKLRTEVEKDLDDALDNGDGKTARIKLNEYNKINKELAVVRRKAYDTESFQRIYRADQVSTSMQDALRNYKRQGLTPTVLEDDILTNSGKYWQNEKINAQKEGRGKKVPTKPQVIGKSIDQQKGEWPDAAGPRQVTQIASAGLFGRETVDGIPVKRAHEITTNDGVKIRMYDMAGGKEVQNSEGILNTVASLHELYPQKPPKKVVVLNETQTRDMAGPGTNAFVFPGADYIFVNKGMVNRPNTRGNWMMPGAKEVPGHQYIVSHEFGHQFDATNQRGSARGMYANNNVKKHLSTYGKHVAEEGYAEAFAEWHVTKGQTTNPAAVAYARHEKWYGHDRVVRTAEGAAKYGVSIGQKIPAPTAAELLGPIVLVTQDEVIEEWNPWRIAEEMGIISFAAKESTKDPDEEVEPVVGKFFPKIPVITEDWEDGPKYLNMESFEANEEEKTEAEKVAREVWKELGLEWEE